MANTQVQFQAVITECRQLFAAKASDYGASWLVLRPSSLTDQIFIKAKRIRQIEETGKNAVGESIQSEFIGIINYCVIALIQLDEKMTDERQTLIDTYILPNAASMPKPEALALLLRLFDVQTQLAYETLLRKNQDYGEAWREMRISSMTDLILMRILRIRQIEDQAGQTQASEGVESNYIDMLNYAVFALIRFSERM